MSLDFSDKVQQAASDHAWRMINMTERLLLGPLTPRVSTPSAKVFMWERSCLLHFTPIGPTKGPPLLIIPPLMVDPVIFDLRAGHSFVRHLMEQGIDVYLIDLGVPDKSFRELALDHYIVDFIEPAFEKVLELSGADRIFLYGWSMGGIMSYIFTALRNRPEQFAGVITCGSPVDFSEMFPFHLLAKIFRLPLHHVVPIIGNVPSPLIRLGFRLISPVATVMRYGELAANYHDREWVAGYESIDHWVDSLLPYAQETFRQFVEECIIDDKLKKGDLEIDGRKVDLSNITCPVMAVMGETDKLAPMPSVEPIKDLAGSEDITLHTIPGGHIGMVAGRTAPDKVWMPIGNWIQEKSGALS